MTLLTPRDRKVMSCWTLSVFVLPELHSQDGISTEHDRVHLLTADTLTEKLLLGETVKSKKVIHTVVF